MLGALEILRTTPLTPEQAEELEIASNSAKLVVDIVAGVFDYTRLDAGHAVLQSLPVDPRALLDDVLQVHAPSVAAKGLKLAAWLDARIASELVIDPNRFRRVLLNLIGNAVRCTASGTIDVRLKLVADRDDFQHLEISVADSGVGISAGQKDATATLAGRAESVLAATSGASGLGLALCARLTRLMGGELTVQGKPGTGTVATMRITLAVARRAPEPSALTGLCARMDAIGDSDDACLIREYLGALGISVWPADSGQQADFQFADASGTGLLPALPTIVLESRSRTGHDGGDGIVLRSGPVWWRALRAACLQAAGAAGGTGEARPEPPGAASTKTILVVEDYLPFQVIMQRQLELLGLQCTIAADGDEALELLKQRRYDLVFTDCQMPGMDGFELAGHIRPATECGNAAVPIVALTGATDDDVAGRCVRAGMNAYLTKPVQMDALRQCIERWAR
ncbi:response regulator [Cupriavidus sp. IDO]|uniref:response regulator n=1 Tax=Cupriavidus sp. IDO TaxID=1539142 RepID=UPI0005797B10|nr:response regulator [Cupriavidus sp. IDO]KWR85136.1 hypothetical protein RM96_27745 [Cupriavidus sp. IDO]